MQAGDNRIRLLRNRRNLSQEELAKSLFITQATLSYYEQGIRDIPSSILIKISNHFNVSIDYILCNDTPAIKMQSSKQSKLYNGLISSIDILNNEQRYEVKGYINRMLEESSVNSSPKK